MVVLLVLFVFLFFFFKQKTAYEMRISDWSSDVCSSDLDRLADHVKQTAKRSVVDEPRPAARGFLLPAAVRRLRTRVMSKDTPDPRNWQLATRLVRGGTARREPGTTSEANSITPGFCYESASAAAARLKDHLPGFVSRRDQNNTNA